MPWAGRPISFPNNVPHTSLYRGIIRRWGYSIIYPVMPSNTAPTISYNNFIGNFLEANWLGVAGVSVSSMHDIMTSWVSVLRLDLVFFARLSPSLFEILFGFGCGSIRGNGGDLTTISFSPTGSLSGSFSYGGEWDGVKSPPLPRIDPHPKTNNISNNDGDMPSKNTRAKRRTLTQEFMLSCMELIDTPATPRQLVSRKFPMKFFLKLQEQCWMARLDK